jgi:hypothetical protein
LDCDCEVEASEKEKEIEKEELAIIGFFLLQFSQSFLLGVFVFVGRII